MEFRQPFGGRKQGSSYFQDVVLVAGIMAELSKQSRSCSRRNDTASAPAGNCGNHLDSGDPRQEKLMRSGGIGQAANPTAS